jgi:hypothetical protein
MSLKFYFLFRIKGLNSISVRAVVSSAVDLDLLLRVGKYL